MAIHKFAFPTTIHFGPGARKLVAAHLVEAGCRRPLIVTDKGIAALPVLVGFRGTLAGLDAGVYSGVQGNPVASQVRAGAEALGVDLDPGIVTVRSHRTNRRERDERGRCECCR